MLRVSFRHPQDWSRLGRAELGRLKGKIVADLTAGLQAMQESILRTPVYTGRTLVNFQWTLGGPAGGVRQPVKEPALPGETSQMRLGSEPRRAANAAVVEQEFAAVLAGVRRNPFQDVYLVNHTPYFSDVEFGTYSTRGEKHRTPPGGMVRRGETLLEVNIMLYRRGGGGV